MKILVILRPIGEFTRHLRPKMTVLCKLGLGFGGFRIYGLLAARMPRCFDPKTHGPRNPPPRRTLNPTVFFLSAVPAGVTSSSLRDVKSAGLWAQLMNIISVHYLSETSSQS